MNIRTALLYRKNLATLMDESARTSLLSFPAQRAHGTSENICVAARRSYILDRGCPTSEATSTRLLQRVRILGPLQVHEMRHAVL
jgi:hypothetical protein